MALPDTPDQTAAQHEDAPVRSHYLSPHVTPAPPVASATGSPVTGQPSESPSHTRCTALWSKMPQLWYYNLRVQGGDAVRDIVKQLVREECGPGVHRITVGATPMPGVLRARILLQPFFK